MVNRFLAQEKKELDDFEALLESKDAEITSMEEEHGGDESPLNEVSKISEAKENLIEYSELAYAIHFPEINTKFIQGDWSGLHNGELRYFSELQHKFENPARVIAYVVAFFFLALHLLHGFNSAFQSVGANNKYTKGLKTFGTLYAILIPLGFVFVAIFHHLNH